MLDLFTPRFPEEKLHDHFRLISADPDYTKVQPIIQNWATGLLDRRGENQKFIKEFQTTFNSSMWELYLNRALIDLKCSVDFSKSAPDFFVRGPGNYEFNIEAVVSDQPPTAKQRKNFDEQEFKTRGALKLAGKIRDKLDLFRGRNGKKHPYSSRSHVQGRPFVIAIAPFDSDLSLTQNNELINMVLFGLTPPVLEGPDYGKQGKITSLLKPSGAPVEMGIFTNDSFKEISAVFFSTVGTFGKAVVESKINRLVRATRYRVIDKHKIAPGSVLWQVGTHRFQLAALNYLLTQRRESEQQIGGADVLIQHSSFHRETHLDGLQVYFNPYAEVPFDPNFPWPAEIALNYYDVESREHIQAHPDGALVSRQVYAITPTYIRLLLGRYGFLR
ncbi:MULTISPECIES: hypothetical protein [Rhizobium/Agrobacterium group]|uniref:Glycosaminoglycan attachment site n=1 Tax=Agrobacterium tumefaciens TaxID=358 RepID=K7X7F5_AGRTU|nr:MULTISPECIES: hypothetical protein [Rhizobium/Agrobacterium group]AFX65578.1 Hypothetical protein [Agrobacterium radiobacter]KEA03028.1 hypothetical protein CN09_33565 [Rhizobium rhizogenes]NTI38976.1 hypothetical protein [Rhizobium rhizogenes]NTI85160.1 hypothetical protein [Rhizobium rhizogenes]NTJ27346.1 hypothetical protein [Rhizobium rhizogenes]